MNASRRAGTPRRIRTTRQAFTIRAGILDGRLRRVAAYDVGNVRLYARAYVRTVGRTAAGLASIGLVPLDTARALAVLPPDPLGELWVWLEHDLARQAVPYDRRPDRRRPIRRYGATSLEYFDRAGIRRIAFHVTTPDLEFIDQFLPRGPIGEWPPEGWSPVHDRPLAQIDADLEAAYEATVCPECSTGKHRNCRGDAWSVQLDERVECSCAGSEVHDFAVAAERKANS